MMGIMYAWATKEYLLERMTFQQIVMYLNYGIDIKNPKPSRGGNSLVGASAQEIQQRHEELRKQYGPSIEGL